MESKLQRLFDYQRYEGNKELKRITSQVEQKYDNAYELVSEEALSFVAGGRQIEEKPKKDPEETDGNP